MPGTIIAAVDRDYGRNHTPTCKNQLPGKSAIMNIITHAVNNFLLPNIPARTPANIRNQGYKA
jgi:hypothetical protein